MKTHKALQAASLLEPSCRTPTANRGDFSETELFYIVMLRTKPSVSGAQRVFPVLKSEIVRGKRCAEGPHGVLDPVMLRDDISPTTASDQDDGRAQHD